jgi:hypothetical protein
MSKTRAGGRECYHCRQWIAAGEPHDCWTTTEGALTRDLSQDLQEAYERIRETAVEFGEQRIYASLNSIMFSRKACYFFVRPKKQYLEVCVFLGRALKTPLVRRAMPASKTKFANLLRIQHRDQVESPLTDWMREAYEQSDALGARAAAGVRKPANRKKPAPGGAKARPKVSSRSASAARNRPRSRRAASGGRRE